MCVCPSVCVSVWICESFDEYNCDLGKNVTLLSLAAKFWHVYILCILALTLNMRASFSVQSSLPLCFQGIWKIRCSLFIQKRPGNFPLLIFASSHGPSLWFSLLLMLFEDVCMLFMLKLKIKAQQTVCGSYSDEKSEQILCECGSCWDIKSKQNRLHMCGFYAAGTEQNRLHVCVVHILMKSQNRLCVWFMLWQKAKTDFEKCCMFMVEMFLCILCDYFYLVLSTT